MPEVNHVFVNAMPSSLEPNTLYVCGRYAVAAHLCMCGCGTKIVTPLGPAEWTLSEAGHAVTLWPSIGNGGLPCHSHYLITNSTVRWLPDVGARAQRLAFAGDERELNAQMANDARWWLRLGVAVQRWLSR